MKEIKLDKLGLEIQLQSLEAAGKNIETSNTEVPDEGVNTLVTSMKYIEQHKQIAELCELYKQLIAKDAADIRNMQQKVSILDSQIANMFKR